MVRYPHISRFCRKEDGALTAFGLFILVAGMMIGGMALDVGYAVMARTQLQVAADSAAHAAIVARHRTGSEAAAKAVAVSVAGGNLMTRAFGDTVRAEDIRFGVYDPETDDFTETAGGPAVLVNSKRLLERENALGLFFMRFVGIGSMDVRTSSVFTEFTPPCFQEGFVAGNRIDIQSNNVFSNGFCMHSNGEFAMNRNNVFEDGTIVSMPSGDGLTTPGGSLTGNPGLADALRIGGYTLDILNRIDDIIATFDDPFSRWYREDYFGTFIDTVELDVSAPLDAAAWVPGAIHSIRCGGGDPLDALAPLDPILPGGKGGKSTLTIPANVTLVKGVIVTDCAVSIGANAALEDVLIISTSTDRKAIDGKAKVRLGRDDACSPGGGVQLVTRGGIEFAANLEIYGSQLIAAGSIKFAANADGLEGVSMVAGDTIDSTSNMTMGFCDGDGMENLFTESTFRLIR